MKLSLNWIREFVDIPKKYSPKQLAELLTLRTCEVEGYEDQARGLEGVLVGKILSVSKHPNADKLSVATVDIGRSKPLQLIFGQMVKMNVGDKVPVAVAPTTLPTGIKIEAKELRGVGSEGMLCLEQELGFEKEGVSILYFPKIKPGTPLAVALGLDDVIFEIDNKSLTHRPDLWGHYGMAREFAAFLGLELKKLAPKINFPKSGPAVKVDVKSNTILNRFLAVIVGGVTIEESPEWLKRKIGAVGMRPVNNVVDITNYVMLETGYPMHAFDRRTVYDDHFIIRYAKDGEILQTLDHKKRTLTAEDALVTSPKEALGIAGIMGGVNSEVSADTNEVIFEIGNWNPVMIRKTAQRYNLRTDAAQRFEKSLDPELALLTMQRACELLLLICKNAKIAGPLTDVYIKKAKPVIVTIDPAVVNRKIGVNISEKEMAAHLKALEFGVVSLRGGRRLTKQSRLLRSARNDTILKVTVPTFRATKDISIEDDLVEEIARLHGYENIPPHLPSLSIRLPIPNRERTLKHEARDILSLGLGFSETSHYSFYGVSEIQKCLLPRELHVEIENPLTADQTHLRISLLPHMLKSVALNLKFREEFKIYEIGRTYIDEKSKVKSQKSNIFPLEEKFICGVVVKPGGEEVFYDALGALQVFLERFETKRFRALPTENPPPYAHPAKCASVVSENTVIATVYEVHPQVLKNFGIEENAVAAFEINFTKLVALGQQERAYKPLPRFPGIEIDVSVLCQKHTPVREIKALVQNTDRTLITNVSIVDIFEDKSLGEDKKSVTVRVLLQSPDRTLTDEEMTAVQQLIFRTLQDSGFTIRGLA